MGYCLDFPVVVMSFRIVSRHKGWGCQPGAWRTLKALKTLILKLKKEKKGRNLKKERVLAD